MTDVKKKLLGSDEPASYTITRDHSSGPFFITVDHASNRIPKALNNLGLAEEELNRHIAIDIGALNVAKLVSDNLNAPMIYQNYSRLVIDCNRLVDQPDVIPVVSEYTEITGNVGLDKADIDARIAEIHTPYHEAISNRIDRWADVEPIFVAVHSCTPVYKGDVRELEIGVLWGNDGRFAELVLNNLIKLGVKAEANAPYTVGMETDYSIPLHAEARNLPYVEIEFRQDLVASEQGVQYWADKLTQALVLAHEQFVAGN